MSENDDIQAVRDEVAELRAQLAQLTAEPDGGSAEPAETADVAVSRRGWVKAAAGAAVGGTALALAGSQRVAADPGDLTLGANTSTTGQTTGTKTGAGGGTSFLFRSGTDFINSFSAWPSALGGWGMLSEQTVGVYGFSNQSGTRACGVVGVSGGPDTVGVRGRGPTAIEGVGSVLGVRGRGPTAIEGVGSVLGVRGEGPEADFIASGSGKVLISMAGTPGPTASGVVGTIARDGDGALWYCYATDKWRELAGATSTGAFHAISPKRVYDSRAGQAPLSVTKGKLSPGSTRVIDCTVDAPEVPDTATAVVLNLTAANTTGLGNLAVYPDGSPAPDTSSINFTGGVNIANSTTSGCGPGAMVRVLAGGSTGADFIIDIVGYYV